MRSRGRWPRYRVYSRKGLWYVDVRQRMKSPITSPPFVSAEMACDYVASFERWVPTP